ncbi:hypothetical protein PN498_12835 [Oscillatoria sp. CS-180]|uniref:hypothetical protein n=1 Tax=Oscillatoria sp. CS-180 TaxID=3021720 RepID=UPI00232E1BF5|nr:hypothetical protein [Oscillatoria sp. CS-180]MDB9526877.1 hypothetical protein [Oscillatoria sp. CS-180]
MKSQVSQTSLQRHFEAQITPGGFGRRPLRPRPQLTAKWVVGKDGELICQWTQR